jgi:hypothetical protein
MVITVVVSFVTPEKERPGKVQPINLLRLERELLCDDNKNEVRNPCPALEYG